MPELPEVETIRRDLSGLIIGKKISGVEVRVASMVSPRGFAKILAGRKIEKIERRAKLLIFSLSNGLKMLVHLKLTGQLVYRNKKGAARGAAGGHPLGADLKVLPNKFSHVIFNFSGGGRLFFNDMRKFGYLKIVKAAELERVEAEYGTEPLSKAFTLKKFRVLLARRLNLKIKQFLMEQNLLAGIGNIYSDEACFCAGVRPVRTAKSLTASETKKLRRCIIGVLKLALKKRGASAENYVDAYGRAGDFVPYLKVYGRAGEKCRRGGVDLLKLKIGGRTSVYCPRCQK
ncbi:MAG: bifunctional DNA-formamidopyrimidine glycosylase/DNA-(apurinic or apyrimidinic site) lyase [Candidatus Magasanikbacteria bacterium]|nr:bifunctional DNA-formamidopyrimidine glycosylase/DNA-(apurinic or apyrimidinic site) lyase [Candidatus Magasanikbacteria bacterium]